MLLLEQQKWQYSLIYSFLAREIPYSWAPCNYSACNGWSS